MNFVTSIVANAVACSVAKTKCGVSNQEIKRRELAFTKIALELGNNTKKSIAAALRADKIGGTPVNVENVQAVRASIDNVRSNRILVHLKERGCNISSLPVPTGRLPITLRPNNRMQQLTTIRRNIVKKYALSLIRSGAPGGTSMKVNFASVTGDVDYKIGIGRVYNVYRGSYKGWGANVDNHTIVVPADWRIRVLRKGLAELGGMLTLDALRLESPPDFALYAAVWVEQSRGYSIKVERGFIAISGGEHYHAATIEGAVRGIKSKNKAAATLTEMNLSTNEFADKYSKISVDVSLDDARKSGSCEYGIRSWCASVGIDIARIHVPIAELLGGFRRMPLPEVRRAVLHAVRKNRVACPS